MPEHPFIADFPNFAEARQTADLILALMREFPKEPPHFFRLSDSIFADNWCQNRDGCFEEAWKDWTEIEDWQIADTGSLPFSYADEDECLYLAPRYMVWILRQDLRMFDSYSIAGEGFLWWFLPRFFDPGKTSLFTEAQRSLVESFLTRLKASPLCADILEDWEKSSDKSADWWKKNNPAYDWMWDTGDKESSDKDSPPSRTPPGC